MNKRTSDTRRTIMVLTQDPQASQAICEQLAQQGFDLRLVRLDSQVDWQTQLVEMLPDAILLDIHSSSGLGWEIRKMLQENPMGREIPLLLYTSSQPSAALPDLEPLTKPVEPGDLTRALEQESLVLGDGQSSRVILVVDDEPNTLELHARIVQSHSPSDRVLRAGGGQEALKILARETVDLVLLDLQMPEPDGFQILEKMRDDERMRKIPVIVVTGKVLTEKDMARLTRGVATVLEKGLFRLEETVTHIRAALERKQRLSGEAQRLVRKAMAFIHEHYAEPLTRRKIAQHVSIAEDYLTYCFRQELGTTPIKYLQRYRVSRARLLLRESNSTITEIARQVGFSDSGYFSRIFHRETGMSPEAYRRA